MISDENLIFLLSDGEFHSGEEIGIELNVSRTAIWKRLKKIAALGLIVESVQGKGYRLSQSIEFLDKRVIEQYLSERSLSVIKALDIQSVIDSTNNLLLESPKFLRQSSTATICLAEYQSQGRGRRGRQWISPYGSNLSLSVGWQFEGGVAALEGLSLSVGVIVARSLSEFGVSGVSLKWPNDILVDGAKLGGILIDVKGDHAGPCYVVVGVGLNVNMSYQEVDIDQSWVDLKSVCGDVSRNKLAASVINGLIAALVSYETEGFQSYMAEWRQLDAYSGRSVEVNSGRHKTVGTCSGVAANGALIIEVEGVQRQMHGGELSLRLNNES